MAGRDGFGEGALQQHLREQRLGVDLGALAEQDQADEREEEGRDEAGHSTVLTVIASERSDRIEPGEVE